MGNKTAIILGATGLVGTELTKKILSSDDYSTIRIISRKTTGIKDYRVDEVIKELDQLEEIQDKLVAEDIFCCIGTTMKKAGSKDVFIKVDYEYPLNLARIALKQGKLKRFLIVTAAGSNPDSSIFYNQVKGDLERDLEKLGIPALHIFRPNLLLGERKEFRFWESVGKFFSAVLSIFIIGSDRKLWAIQSEQVAEAMFKVSQTTDKGVFYYEPKRISEISKK